MFIAFICEKNLDHIASVNDGVVPKIIGDKYYFVHYGPGRPNQIMTERQVVELLDGPGVWHSQPA